MQFEPMFLTGSLAVFIGAAEPRFAGLASHRRRRRNALGLIQEYCTSKEFASFEGSPRFARRLFCTEFSGQKSIPDFAFGAQENF
jgi:hypothetical protein